jgi:hypothetical protein
MDMLSVEYGKSQEKARTSTPKGVIPFPVRLGLGGGPS